MAKPITENTLFYGDNLPILREYIPDESVDLVYLDPPFNSNRTYNVLFKRESGEESEAQIAAFDDTWHWNMAAETTYRELATKAPAHVSQMISALRGFIGDNQMMAYLVMMAARLLELHRVLRPTGSLYLHCDPTASHYLKIVMDTIFGPQNLLNEIIWQRTAVKGDVRRKFGAVHDTLLVYTRGGQYTFNIVYALPDEEYHQRFKYDDQDGRGPYQSAPLDSPNPRPNLTYEYKGYSPPPKGWRVSRAVMESLDAEGRLIFPPSRNGRIRRKVYLREQGGPKIADVWTDITPLQGPSMERLGYPTQKPVALLERIIQASSNPGDVVLDPFCGCGTTIAAAQKLGRRWIGIDITYLSIALQKNRLATEFPDATYTVIGEPTTLHDARQLSQDSRFQFQWWALSLIQARPYGGDGTSKQGKKGADKGIDGIISFIDDHSGKAKRAIVQVKSGKVGMPDISHLVGTITRESAAIGVFLTLEEPTRNMRTEAASAGFYHSPGWNRDYPRIQILTVNGLLSGSERLELPPAEYTTFKKAQQAKEEGPQQKGLFD